MAVFRIQSGGPIIHTSLGPVAGSEACSRIWVGLIFTSRTRTALTNSQDPLNARFEACTLPYIAAIPAVVAGCVLLALVFQVLLPRWTSPQWTRPFVEEPKDWLEDDRPQAERPFTLLARSLLVMSIAGFILQVITLFYPSVQKQMEYPTVTWALICVLIAVRRPATPSKSLLALYLSIFFSQFVVSLHHLSHLSLNTLHAIFLILTTAGALWICLQMPMRHPTRSNEDISPAFEPPTIKLRSPEDNITLWQWMSVSWMAPLISVGYERQLNEEDVWLLGYEFQHRTLHERFRETKGSLVWRLLGANGLDCVLISLLAILETVASMSRS